MNNAIILGDVHLGKSLSIGKIGVANSINSRIEDQLNLLDWVLDKAIDHSAGHIILTGDIFEEPKPPPNLIVMFISWLKKCQSHNVHCHIIKGNHDILRNGFVYSSPLDILSEVELENVHVYSQIDTIFINTTAITMMPFRDRKSFGLQSNAEALNLLKDSLIYELNMVPITYKKILVGHLAIEGSIFVGDEVDDISNELFCPIDMFKGYDNVWMGHVHKPQILNKSKPLVAHVGSMDISNFGESDHKKYIVIIDCDDLNSDYSIEYLPTRQLKKIAISIPKGTTDTTKFVSDHINDIKDLDKSIVRVEISLGDPELLSVNKSLIDKLLTEKGVFNVSAITESKKTQVIKNEKSQNLNSSMDVISASKIYADAVIDKTLKTEFIDCISKLLNKYKLESKE